MNRTILVISIVCVPVLILSALVLAPLNHTLDGILLIVFAGALVYSNWEWYRQTVKVARLRKRIEEADRQKAAFVHDVSNEIRTPLTVISGFAQLLDNDMLGVDERIKFVNLIRENVERLTNLVYLLAHNFAKLQKMY